MRVLVTGIGGQDGYYLTKLLLEQGHLVYGISRSLDKATRLTGLSGAERLQLLAGDVTDQALLRQVIGEVQPDQIYNLAAQSRVGRSFAIPEETFKVNTMVPLYLLEIIRDCESSVRLFQACSAEVFGENPAVPQNESTPFAPASPYAVSKASAHWLIESYRRAYGLYACNGILYNHESELRDESFLSGKVVRSLARILKGEQQTLVLGNLQVQRDWGYAGDFAQAMVQMLAQDSPDDYVIATGETHSVEEFVDAAFRYVGLDWRQYVVVDPGLFRPTDAQLMRGDARRARERLGWQPRVDFHALVHLMVDSAIEQAKSTGLQVATSHDI